MSLKSKFVCSGQEFEVDNINFNNNLEDAINAVKQAQTSATEFLSKLIKNDPEEQAPKKKVKKTTGLEDNLQDDGNEDGDADED